MSFYACTYGPRKKTLLFQLAGGKFQGGMDGGIRVPGLIRWPGHISPHTEVHVPLSQMDFLPTVAEVAGVPVPADRVIDGVSLVPLLTGHTKHTEREYLVHYCSNHIHALRFRPEQGENMVNPFVYLRK